MDKQDFEQYAQEKVFNFSVSPLWEEQVDANIRKHGGNVADLTLLDFGCGDGKYFPWFTARGLRPENIHGVEVSKIRVERCHGLGWHNAVYIENGSDLPFEDNTFDLVNMMEVIEHVPAHAISHVLGEIRRVMKPGGIIILSTPNYPIKRFYDLHDAVFNKKWNRLKDDPTHVCLYNFQRLQKTLGMFFSDIAIVPYKRGFLYNRFAKAFFMHKLLASCVKKR